MLVLVSSHLQIQEWTRISHRLEAERANLNRHSDPLLKLLHSGKLRQEGGSKVKATLGNTAKSYLQKAKQKKAFTSMVSQKI